MKEMIFPEANVKYLRGVAKGLGLEIKIPDDIREVQKLKDLGVRLPFDLDPEEAYLLQQILKLTDKSSKVPKDFGFYLNDRVGTDIPEGVRGIVKREQKTTLKEINALLDELHSELKK